MWWWWWWWWRFERGVGGPFGFGCLINKQRGTVHAPFVSPYFQGVPRAWTLKLYAARSPFRLRRCNKHSIQEKYICLLIDNRKILQPAFSSIAYSLPRFLDHVLLQLGLSYIASGFTIIIWPSEGWQTDSGTSKQPNFNICY